MRRSERRAVNVVFMGMGEPFANYDATWAAVERIHDDLGLSARHITISTVGILPGIRRLSSEQLPVNLAVSLHAATDDLRDELVPINRRYPLTDLETACATYLRAKGRRLSFEWALIDGVNDGPEQAMSLAALCRRLPLPAHVNLIPLNPTPGYPVQGTPPAGVRAFRDRLKAGGVNVTVRQTRGVEIEAACGQLRAEHEARPVAAPRRRHGRDEHGAPRRVADGADELLAGLDDEPGPDDGPLRPTGDLGALADDRAPAGQARGWRRGRRPASRSRRTAAGTPIHSRRAAVLGALATAAPTARTARRPARRRRVHGMTAPADRGRSRSAGVPSAPTAAAGSARRPSRRAGRRGRRRSRCRR